MGRPRVYEARDIARDMRETFAARPVEYKERVPGGWPDAMQNIGSSLAVAYGSDKWKKRRSNGSREVELYKHLAESRNWAFARSDLLHDYYKPNEGWDTVGPMVSLDTVPLPSHFAILGFCEAVYLQLYTGSNARPKLDHNGKDALEVTFPHGMLGASKIMWNEVDPYRDEIEVWHEENPDTDDEPPDFNQPFLFVYTKRAGVMMIIVGEQLAVEKGGIVG